MTFQDEVWRAVELALRIKGGRMQVGSLKLPMPLGPAAVSMTADVSTSPVPVSLTVHAPGIPLALLARYASLPGQVSGTARIEANLHGIGRTVRGLAASLDGPVSVTAVGGQMSNAALIKLASASLDALAQVSGSPVSVPVVIEGPFHAIAGRLDADAFHKLGLLFDAWFGGDR